MSVCPNWDYSIISKFESEFLSLSNYIIVSNALECSINKVIFSILTKNKWQQLYHFIFDFFFLIIIDKTQTVERKSLKSKEK